MRETSAPAVSQLALLALASAALGAVLVASSDCSQGLAIATGAGVFALQGVALGLLARLAFALATWLGARTGRRLDAHAVIAGLAALAALAPGFELFSGHGVRRTALGVYGPYLFALLAAAASWLLSRRIVPTLQRGRWQAWSLALLCLLLLPPLVFLGRVSYPGLYRGIHTALVVGAGALGLLAALPFVQRALPRWLALGVIALVCVTGTATALAFGRDNRERKCLEGSSELAYLGSYLRERVDLDGDGASALFGGGDCADWNGSVGPAAVDAPGDGRDSDCDGRDGGPAITSGTQRRFRGDPAMAARIRELARGRPTVVLLIDALRDDRVGMSEFPALSTLARESLRFRRAYANSSSTKSSLAAMLSGRLHPLLTTPGLGQRLRAAGKRPAFVGVHLEDDIGELYPVLRGFDPVQWLETDQQQRSAWGSGVRERTSAQITELVLGLLDQARPPDLILAHYFDVHQWHELFRGPRERAPARYDAAVRWVDQQLAPLIARRDQINLVLLSDHGEALNGLERLWHTTYVGAEVVRVPWLIRVPGLAPASVDAAIGLSELAPTLLDLLGVGLPADFAGRSALALVGVAQPGHGPPIIALEPREWSILDGDLRLRYAPYSRSLWLHDVAADPDERVDISGQQPERVAALRSALLAAVRAIEREHGGPLRYGYEE